jgi:hypothetical protein
MMGDMRQRIFTELTLTVLRMQVAVRSLRLRAGRAMSDAAELAGGYAEVRRFYQETVYLAVMGYLVQTGVSSTQFKNEIKRDIADNFPKAFYEAYKAGGVEEVDPADDDWLTAKMNAELGFVDLLFVQLKDLKDENVPPSVYVDEANRRAEGYVRTLDGVFDEGRLRGAANIMLTMDGDDGEESCPDCQRLKGKRHSARWWVKRGLVPGQPGNGNYQCKGYKCQHFLRDDSGARWTQ